MQRRLISIMLLIALGSCAAGVWFGQYPSAQSFIVADAIDIRIIDKRPGTRRIMYQAPGAPYAWRVAIASALEQHGWVSAPWWRTDLSYLSYTHVRSSRFVTLWEEADLQGGPHTAQISVRRWLEVHWGRRTFRIGNRGDMHASEAAFNRASGGIQSLLWRLE